MSPGNSTDCHVSREGSDDPVEQILQEAIRLPSFPDVLLRLDEELRRDQVDFARVASLVRMDPVLSGQILRVANSSWYSRGGPPVNDLVRAIIRLGLPATTGIVQALLLPSLFPQGTSLDLAGYWRHSFAVALQAQSIGRMLKLPADRLSILWTAGILHDIGAVLFDLLAGEKLRTFLRALSAEGEELILSEGNFSTLESKWLGADHAMLGSAFLQRTWNLPEEIVRLVRHHENPKALAGDALAFRTVLPLHVAEVLCEERGVNWLPCKGHRLEELGPIWQEMQMGPEMIGAMAEEVDQVVRHADTLLLKGLRRSGSPVHGG